MRTIPIVPAVALLSAVFHFNRPPSVPQCIQKGFRGANLRPADPFVDFYFYGVLGHLNAPVGIFYWDRAALGLGKEITPLDCAGFWFVYKAHPPAHIEICAVRWNAVDGPKDKQDVDLFLSMTLTGTMPGAGCVSISLRWRLADNSPSPGYR